MRSIANLLHYIDHSQHRLVGIAGTQTGVGVSRLARSIAQAMSSRGDSVLLLNVSPDGPPEPADAMEDAAEIAPSEFLALAQREGDMRVLDTRAHVSRLPRRASDIRNHLRAFPDDTTVIMDLPPVQAASELTRPWSMEAAAACQAVYLMCLSGETRKRELLDAVTICRAQKLNLAAIILNDRKLAGSAMLPGVRADSKHLQPGWGSHGA